MPRGDRRSPRFGERYVNQVAVVTGASMGLGEQLCRDLVIAGATVIGLARNVERLSALESELQERSPLSEMIVCDVADSMALRGSLAAVMRRHGRVDILINNAALDPGVRLADITEEDFRHTFDVNFFAAVSATLACLPAMTMRGSGIIINVSSDGGRLPAPGPGAYPASKAALSAFSESIAYRLSPKGVHVHVVYPAFMATELGRGALESGLRRPPRLTTRTVGSVSHTILARAGGSALDISVARVIDAAMVLRYLAPKTFRRARSHW